MSAALARKAKFNAGVIVNGEECFRAAAFVGEALPYENSNLRSSIIGLFAQSNLGAAYKVTHGSHLPIGWYVPMRMAKQFAEHVFDPLTRRNAMARICASITAAKINRLTVNSLSKTSQNMELKMSTDKTITDETSRTPRVTYRHMSVEEFSLVPINPRQCNTEENAKFALKNHLSQYRDSQAIVTLFRLPDGSLYKGDGHTRSYLWDRNLLKRPAVLSAIIIDCADIQEVCSMFETFDNSGAAKRIEDDVYGIARQMDFNFKSELLKKSRFANAMNVASRAFGSELPRLKNNVNGVEINMREFREELILLDSINPPEDMKSGVLAGALICFRINPEKATEFFTLYSTSAGELRGSEGRCDPVYALHEATRTQRKGGSRAGRSLTLDICGKTISAFQKYLKNESYAVTSKGVAIKSTIRLAGIIKPKFERPGAKKPSKKNKD